MNANQISGKVLIVDDEQEIVDALARLMRQQGLTPLLARDGEAALNLIRAERPDLLLVDYHMPGKNGLEVLQEAKALDRNLLVILITGFAEIRGAVEAMRIGAHDYLAKPFEHHEIVRVVRRAMAERKPRMPQFGALREMLGPSESIGKVIADVERVAESNFSVLILGETGSGKEVIARAVHEASARSKYPFIPVDCGAIPETLMESELFGHERGAFTGASQQKPGLFEMVRGGTLFLDEVSNLPLASQAKLLQLEHVAGKVEMGLRVNWDVPNIFEYFVNTHDELRAARDRILGADRPATQEEKIELGRTFDRLLSEDRDNHTEQVERVLSRACCETKPGKCRTEQEVMNLACLVEREKQERFAQAVFQAAKMFDNNFAFDYNGPWAPHNFVNVALEP